MSDSVLYDEKAIYERYGLKADQMVDYKGLRGDPSDNLPGVRGVGEKTATELLKKYKTLENIYKNLPRIKEGIRRKLERDKVQAYFSKKLARLADSVPAKFDLEKARAEDFSRVKIINLLRELEFFSLLRRLPGYDEHVKNVEEDQSEERGVGKISWRRIKSSDWPEIRGNISIATGAGEIAVSLDARSAGYISKIDEGVKKILEDKKIEKMGYDLKQDWKNLQSLGIELEGIGFDVQLAAYLLASGSNISWENLVMQELGALVEKEDKKSGQAALFFPEGILWDRKMKKI